jgi:hypothetical protein
MGSRGYHYVCSSPLAASVDVRVDEPRGLTLVRTLAIAMALIATAPATATELMTPTDAQRFVAGKLLSYACSDGTLGEGRISPDGSVAGFVQPLGKGPIRFAMLPAGTLRIKDEAVCASLKGLAWEPCFMLVQINRDSFRGSVRGLDSISCTFVVYHPPPSPVRGISAPLSLDAFMKAPGSKVKQ